MYGGRRWPELVLGLATSRAVPACCFAFRPWHPAGLAFEGAGQVSLSERWMHRTDYMGHWTNSPWETMLKTAAVRIYRERTRLSALKVDR